MNFVHLGQTLCISWYFHSLKNFKPIFGAFDAKESDKFHVFLTQVIKCIYKEL